VEHILLHNHKKNIVKGRNFIVLILFTSLIFGCSSGLSSEQIQDKIDSSFTSLEQYLSEFNTNASAANNDTSIENLIRVNERNKDILNKIEDANDDLYTTLMDNWDSIAEGESEYSPGKEVIRDFSLGYKNWIKYQRMNAQIGDDCVYNSTNALECITLNFNKTLENEFQSRKQLEDVAYRITQWQEKYNQ
jgi:hypothetical protein